MTLSSASPHLLSSGRHRLLCVPAEPFAGDTRGTVDDRSPGVERALELGAERVVHQIVDHPLALVSFENEHDLAGREVDAVMSDAGLAEVERGAGCDQLGGTRSTSLVQAYDDRYTFHASSSRLRPLPARCSSLILVPFRVASVAFAASLRYGATAPSARGARPV